MHSAVARRYLSALAYADTERFAALLPLAEAELGQLADWLARHGLAPLVYYRLRQAPGGPAAALAARLRAYHFSAAAQNGFHQDALTAILQTFRRENTPAVLLKGIVLAEAAYGHLAARPMSDIDLWLQDGDMAQAAALLSELGFRSIPEKSERPLTLQRLALGEIAFVYPQGAWGMVDLHWSVFPGWWARRATNVDNAAIWRRTIPFDLPGFAANGSERELIRTLAPEDMVIQLAFHQAVNSQFGQRPLASLFDVALAVKCWPVNWQIVAERARAWRLATVVWLVLSLADALIGLPGVETALSALRPSAARRLLLGRFVSAATMAAAADWRYGRARYLLLLLLVDRPRDMLRLLYRTVWPEPAWLEARYAGRASRARHLWQILRFGQT